MKKQGFEDGRIAVIILAAGLGTRMKSDKAKVLHELCRRPMILYVTETAEQLAGDCVTLVVGHQADEVRRVVSSRFSVRYCLQEKQLGTGHAVKCAMPTLSDSVEEVIILCGDVPIFSAASGLAFLEDHLTSRRDLSVLAVPVDHPDRIRSDRVRCRRTFPTNCRRGRRFRGGKADSDDQYGDLLRPPPFFGDGVTTDSARQCSGRVLSD